MVWLRERIPAYIREIEEWQINAMPPTLRETAVLDGAFDWFFGG